MTVCGSMLGCETLLDSQLTDNSEAVSRMQQLCLFTYAFKFRSTCFCYRLIQPKGYSEDERIR
jgi:hypothetical protein